MNLGGPAGDAHLHNSMTLTEIRTRQGSAIPPGAADAVGLFGGSLSQMGQGLGDPGPHQGWPDALPETQPSARAPTRLLGGPT
jgi:hypothetical protein